MVGGSTTFMDQDPYSYIFLLFVAPLKYVFLNFELCSASIYDIIYSYMSLFCISLPSITVLTLLHVNIDRALIVLLRLAQRETHQRQGTAFSVPVL